MCDSRGPSIGRLGVVTLIVLTVCFIFSGAVEASVLTPGQDITLPDAFTFPCPGVACPVLLAQSKVGVTSSDGKVTFSFNAAVYLDPANPFCSGCFDFVFHVFNSSAS